MKKSRKAVLAIALATATLAALPTAAFAESGACEAARQGNTFEAWFYRTFLC